MAVLPSCSRNACRLSQGFTLIELSIVIVIIGLLVGAVVSGQDLITAAKVRAQITQIDRYNTAATTFRAKYGYLPGDIKDPFATNYGFQSRGLYFGEGDGNGILQANCGNASSGVGNWNGFQIGCGELAVFWQDLSTAGLIDTTVAPNPSNLSTLPRTTANPWPNITLTTSPGMSNWMPTAKVASQVFVYVYSMNSINYFGVSTSTDMGWSVASSNNPGMTVQQAAMIDSKIDDGFPQLGNVTACYVNFNVSNYQSVWAAGGSTGAGPLQGASGGNYCVPTTNVTGWAKTNCYDNSGNVGTQQYSVGKNGSMPNCALSFQFQ